MTESRRKESPGFSRERFLRALLTSDSAPAEVLIGFVLIVWRATILLERGFMFGPVADILRSVYLTSTTVGLLLVSIGIAQIIVGGGTCYYRWRSFLCFLAALMSLGVWLAYVGADLEHSYFAWTWISIVIAEGLLCARILLMRVALLDQLNGHGIHDRR